MTDDAIRLELYRIGLLQYPDLMHRLVNFGQEMLEAGRREEREALQQTIEQLLREQIQRQDAHHNYVDNHHEGMCDMANKCLDAIEGQK